MNGFIRSKLILTLAALFMLAAAIAVPLSGNIIHSRAAPSTVGSEPTWALPFPTGTSVSIGPKGIHGDNFRSIQDDRTHTVYQFANPTNPDSLDLVLEPEPTGTSSIATTPLASGTVLAVWAKCHVVLIDYGNGWWSIYLHLTNISVSSGDSVTVNTKIGYPTTNVQPNKTCGNEQSSAEHVHFAFLNGSGRNGSYVPMLGRVLCGHSVVEQNNDPTNIILQGLTQTKDQVFNIPACGGGFITEFSLPSSNSNPGFMTSGADGNLWFTEPNAGQIGRITTSGTVTEFPVPTANSVPLGITSGPDGALWFTESAEKIGRITTSGTVTEFPLPLTVTPYPGPSFITSGSDGALWFTEFNASQIGRITTSGTITEFPTPAASSDPEGIAAGPDGALWFTESGPNEPNKIGRITTSGTITEFPTPAASSNPFGITAGPDGALWFTESGVNKIGRITTSGTITEFPGLIGGSDPTSITMGPDGALWFTDSDANQIGRITTSGAVTGFPVPTASSNPLGITTGPNSTLWFAENVGDKIGRITP